MRVSLVVSDKNIKIAKANGSRPILVNVPIPEKIVEDGYILDEANFKQVLLKASRDLALSKSDVVVGIPEKHVFSKKIIVLDGDTNFDQKIKEELQSNLPSDASEDYTDWQVIEKKGDKDTIFLVSASARLVDTYLVLFEQCKITVVGVEPISFAMSRHVPKQLAKPQPHPGTKQPVTPLPQIQQSSLVISLEASEALLIIINERGIIGLTSVLPQASLGHVNELIAEVSDMKTFFDKKGEGTPIGKVFLTGEGATEDVKNQISQQLNLPAEFLRIPNPSVALPVALGFFPVFALLDLPVAPSKEHKQINLLPQELLIAHEDAKKRMFLARMMFLATLFVGVFCILYGVILAYLVFDTKTNGDAIKKKTEAIADGDTLATRQRVGRLNKAIAVVKKFADNEALYLSVMSFLSEKTPAGITITHYRIDSGTNSVAINGESLDRDRLLAFKDILETQGKYKNVKIPLTSLEKRGASLFSLSFELSKQ